MAINWKLVIQAALAGAVILMGGERVVDYSVEDDVAKELRTKVAYIQGQIDTLTEIHKSTDEDHQIKD